MSTEIQRLDANAQQAVSYCIPVWLRDLQIAAAIKRIPDRIQPAYEPRREPVAVVCFGPSLADTWEEVKAFEHIITCSGAHKFLMERGIKPTYHVEVDPRPHKVELIGTPCAETTYLIASTCHAKVFDHLEGMKVQLWHVFDGKDEGIRLLPPGEWALTGGCLHATASVRTEDGDKPIKWIVDTKYTGRVLSLDADGRFVWKRIVAHSGPPNSEGKRWVSLRGASKGNLILTEEHRCAVIDDPLDPHVYYLPAKDTVGKYSVRQPEANSPPTGNDYPLYNPEQLSALYGTLMGDSSIGKDGRVSCDHGAPQLLYLELKQHLFGGTITPREHSAKEWGGERLTYRWRQGANAQTRLLRDAIYPKGKKNVAFLLPRLDERSLAFWYMDDGCLHKFDDQRPLVELNTHGFCADDHDAMVRLFRDKWALNARILAWRSRGKVYQKLQFRVDDSEAFLNLVAPFIPPSMQYKVPEHLRAATEYAFDTRPLDYAARHVAKVTYLNPSWCKSKLYDIEVEDTHNFVANRTVVHNCDVGSRAITIAGFLGFRDVHVFGMDGCEKRNGDGFKHAAPHPNEPSKYAVTEYDGIEYRTTPGLLEAARQIWHELDQMPKVRATFHGDGLVQAMAKHYRQKKSDDAKPFENVVGFIKPELISAEYVELNARLHRDNLAYGVGGGKHAETVLKLAASLKTTSVLDYGCGKSMLAKALPFPIWEYDPAIPDKSAAPRPADLVVSTDVLEHIEPDKINAVLSDLKRVTRKVGYLVIHTGESTKLLADGRNAHLLQRNRAWWKHKLKKFFAVAKIIEHGPLLYIIVGPKGRTTVVKQPNPPSQQEQAS